MNHDLEIGKLKEELALVKDVLGNLIAWCGQELGQNAQNNLIDRLYPNGVNADIGCSHVWVSADNEKVTGGKICMKCSAIRAV